MRHSHKTPEELRSGMLELYGEAYGAQRKLAKALKKHEVTISRYMSGTCAVDATTADLFDRLLADHRAKMKRRKSAAPASLTLEDML